MTFKRLEWCYYQMTKDQKRDMSGEMCKCRDPEVTGRLIA